MSVGQFGWLLSRRYEAEAFLNFLFVALKMVQCGSVQGSRRRSRASYPNLHITAPSVKVAQA